ncbi:MAG: PAS domain S-box protein [Candidatus Thermoplasmatota archaeon]|nr:PAS domain S-box protein [Candidatus Thermoplasmatota archaeon]
MEKHKPDIIRQLEEDESLGKLHFPLVTPQELIDPFDSDNSLQQTDSIPVTMMDDRESATSFSEDPLESSNRPASGFKDIAFRRSKNIMILFDRHGQVLDCNDISLRLSGFNREDIIGKQFWKMKGVFKDKNLRQYISTYRTVIRKRMIKQFTNTLLDKDGREHIIDFEAHPIINNDVVTQILLIGNDVTHQKNMIERYRGILDNTSEGIFIFDMKGTILEANGSVERYGFNRDEFIGKNMREHIPKKYWMQVINDIRDLKKGENTTGTIELVTKNGGIVCEYRSSPILEDKIPVGILTFVRDITEKVENEEKIRESEERYRTLFETMGQGVVYQDKHGKIISANPAAEQILGVTLDQLQGRTSIDPRWKTIHEDGTEYPGDTHPSMVSLKTGQKCSGIMGVFNPINSSYRWILVTAIPQFVSSEPTPDMVFTTFEDITQQKSNEMELRDATKKYCGLFNSNPEGILVLDRKGFVTDINQAGLQLFGVSGDKVLGKHFTKLRVVRLRDIPRYSKLFLDIIREKTSGPLIIEIINQETKQPRYTEVFLNLIKENDTVSGIQVVSRDITEKRKAEQLIMESQQRYQNLFDHAADLIAVIDKKGNFIDLNKKFEEESGYSKDEMIGKNVLTSDILTKTSVMKLIPVLTQINKGKQIPLVEIEGQKKQGGIIPYELRAVPIYKDDEIIGAQAILRNLTERKKAQDDLRKAHDELKILNKDLEKMVEERTEQIKQLLQQKDEFINQLGHDLKNPLGPLTNLLPLLEKDETDPKHKEMLTVIIRNVNYMRNLVTKTLTLARLNSPNTQFSFEKLNLKEEIVNVLDTNRLVFQQKKIIINNKVDADCYVTADRLRIEEVLTNLLNNAVKYSPEGSNITVDVLADKDEVVISIKDSGQGMTQDQLKSIFDEFYKVDASRHDFDSSGLGLSICKRIIEKHDGRIWVESQGLGKGSTFYFSLQKYHKN